MREETEKSVAFNHNKAGFLGLLVTLGIVFGDIGTSPLYVMKYCCPVKLLQRK